MKKNRDFYLNVIVFTLAPIVIIAGAITMALTHNGDRAFALGALLILIGVWFLFIWPIRVWGQRRKKKEEAKKSAEDDKAKLIDKAYEVFCNTTDYPKPNTLRLVHTDMVFNAEGRYVLEPYFKNIPGEHFAFEIKSTDFISMPDDYDDVCDLQSNDFISMPDDYDDVCDLQSNGVVISAGYHDGEALERYANDNGIILPNTLSRVIGKPIKLGNDKGYKLEIRTVEGDEVDYGFFKIVKCENDVITLFFSLTALWGLSDTVEGLVELKKETLEQAHDIDSLIAKVKRKQYNVIEVAADAVRAIKEANPFLPESYITFLREVGFADMDWIDVGRNEKTPANLNDEEIKYICELTEQKGDLTERDETSYEDFYFFAVDNSDTYYAFSRKGEDKKVYIFSNDAADVGTYESFEEFLLEIMAI